VTKHEHNSPAQRKHETATAFADRPRTPRAVDETLFTPGLRSESGRDV
jgi:hypothetical protein